MIKVKALGGSLPLTKSTEELLEWLRNTKNGLCTLKDFESASTLLQVERWIESAMLRLEAKPRLRVAPLEWEERTIGTHVAKALGCTYNVHIRMGAQYAAYSQMQTTQHEGRYDSLEEAKAACQAQHEQHVLSMITEVADGAE